MHSKGIQALGKDHQAVLPKLAAMEEAVKAIRKGASFVEAGAPCGAFLEAWRGEIKEHFRQEEEGLFPILGGVLGAQGPIGVMLEEHAVIEDAVHRLEEQWQKAEPDLNRALAAAAVIVYTLKDHIYKEDEVLFPMAEDLLDDGQKKDVDSLIIKVA